MITFQFYRGSENRSKFSLFLNNPICPEQSRYVAATDYTNATMQIGSLSVPLTTETCTKTINGQSVTVLIFVLSLTQQQLTDLNTTNTGVIRLDGTRLPETVKILVAHI